jgi:secreted PhoX family phosphatase
MPPHLLPPIVTFTPRSGKGTVKCAPISCPDNVAFDPHGNLWISTDGNQLGSHDGLFGVATKGERRGERVPCGPRTLQFQPFPVRRTVIAAREV